MISAGTLLVDDAIRTFDFHRLLADFNGDASIDLGDRTRFFDHDGSVAGGEQYDFAFDLDEEGDVDRSDYYLWKRRYGLSL